MKNETRKPQHNLIPSVVAPPPAASAAPRTANANTQQQQPQRQQQHVPASSSKRIPAVSAARPNRSMQVPIQPKSVHPYHSSVAVRTPVAARHPVVGRPPHPPQQVYDRSRTAAIAASSRLPRAQEESMSRSSTATAIARTSRKLEQAAADQAQRNKKMKTSINSNSSSHLMKLIQKEESSEAEALPSLYVQQMNVSAAPKPNNPAPSQTRLVKQLQKAESSEAASFYVQQINARAAQACWASQLDPTLLIRQQQLLRQQQLQQHHRLQQLPYHAALHQMARQIVPQPTPAQPGPVVSEQPPKKRSLFNEANDSLALPIEVSTTKVLMATQFVVNELRENSVWPIALPAEQMAVTIEQFIREVFLPHFSLGASKPDRAFWATLLALREVLMQNADRLFNLTPDTSVTERKFEGQIIATSVVISALRSTPVSSKDHATETFIRFIEEYDKGQGSFAKESCTLPSSNVTASDTQQQPPAMAFLKRVDGRHQPITPNGEALDPEESIAWRVSYNLALKRHHLAEEDYSNYGFNDADYTGIKVPKPTACHVFVVEETKNDDERTPISTK